MFWKKTRREKTERKYESQAVCAPKGHESLGPIFAASPPALHITCEYEDNEILCREFRLSLSPSDWCRFEIQPFYPQLIGWVRSLGNPEILCTLDALEREKN